MDKLNLVIRGMSEKDIPDVDKLAKLVFPSAEHMNSYKLKLKDILVMTYKDVIIGYIQYAIRDDDLEILYLAIHPDLQGKGLGDYLLRNFLKRVLKRRDIKRIVLDVRSHNERAINMYMKHGFKIISTVRYGYDNGDDAHQMARENKLT